MSPFLQYAGRPCFLPASVCGSVRDYLPVPFGALIYSEAGRHQHYKTIGLQNFANCRVRRRRDERVLDCNNSNFDSKLPHKDQKDDLIRCKILENVGDARKCFTVSITAGVVAEMVGMKVNNAMIPRSMSSLILSLLHRKVHICIGTTYDRLHEISC